MFFFVLFCYVFLKKKEFSQHLNNVVLVWLTPFELALQLSTVKKRVPHFVLLSWDSPKSAITDGLWACICDGGGLNVCFVLKYDAPRCLVSANVIEIIGLIMCGPAKKQTEEFWSASIYSATGSARWQLSIQTELNLRLMWSWKPGNVVLSVVHRLIL